MRIAQEDITRLHHDGCQLGYCYAQAKGLQSQKFTLVGRSSGCPRVQRQPGSMHRASHDSVDSEVNARRTGQLGAAVEQLVRLCLLPLPRSSACTKHSASSNSYHMAAICREQPKDFTLFRAMYGMTNNTQSEL